MRNTIPDFLLYIQQIKKIDALTYILIEFVKKNSTIVVDGYPSYIYTMNNLECLHVIVSH